MKMEEWRSIQFSMIMKQIGICILRLKGYTSSVDVTREITSGPPVQWFVYVAVYERGPGLRVSAITATTTSTGKQLVGQSPREEGEGEGKSVGERE